MATEYFGFRLNRKNPEHKEILDWLSRFHDKSDEARRLLYTAIQSAKGEPTQKEMTSISWSFPEEPSIK